MVERACSYTDTDCVDDGAQTKELGWAKSRGSVVSLLSVNCSTFKIKYHDLPRDYCLSVLAVRHG
jgi:hypothetical protein